MKRTFTLFLTVSVCIHTAFSQFTQQVNPTTGELGKLQFVSASEGWITCGSNNNLLHTTNGGLNWNIVTPFPAEATGNPADIGLTMSWANQSYGWVLKTYNDNFADNMWDASDGGVIYKTIDGGNSWTEKKLPKTITTVDYSPSDLVGNWQVHLLSTINKNNVGSVSSWTYGSGSIDLSGNLSFTMTDNNASTTFQQASISVDKRGKVNLSGSMGFLSADKQMMIVTDYFHNQTPTLFIFQKQNTTTTYSSSDLQGDWYMHGLSAGTASGNEAGYVYGIMSCNAGEFSGTLHGSDNSTFPASMSGNITAQGTITFGTSSHGFMSPDKQSFVAVITDDGGAYNLVVFQKKSTSISYNQSDLLGLWQGYSLVADNLNDSQTSTNWARQQIQFSSTGSVSISRMIVNNDNRENIQASVSLTSDGVMTINGMSDSNGFLSPDKSMLIQVNPDGSGGYSLGVSLRDLSISGDVGLQTQFASETNGWCSIYNSIYSNFMLFRTTDGGTTWTQINGTSNPVGGFYYFIDPLNGWMFGQKGASSSQEQAILHTTDGGLSWEVQKENIGSTKAMFFTDDKHGWVVGYNDLILKTIDGGLNWTTVTPAVTYPSGYATITHKSVFFVDNNNGFISTDLDNSGTGFNKSYILQTTDGGTSWKAINTNDENGIFNMYFTDKNNGWYVGGYDPQHEDRGVIVKILISSTGISNIMQNNKISIYPNPASKILSISGITTETNFSLLNSNGQVIKNETLSNTNNLVDVSTLQKGLYLVSLKSKEGISIIKLIKN